jgi:tRNA dimethylallyltransferase
MSSRVLAILGATATGKTAVAVDVARRLDGEIISLDSRQIYRGMDIGTAKPTAEAMQGVPHHGFDLVDPDERFSAGRFADLARSLMADIGGRGRVPILAGGTGFYLRALTHPLFEEPAADASRRERWKRYLAGLARPELVRWAARLDPVAAARLRDRQRLARVIEVAMLTGRPLSWWRHHAPSPRQPIDPCVVVLDLPPGLLARRIEDRVDAMIRHGLADEVRALLDRGYGPDDPGLRTTGYMELIPYILGDRTLEEAAELVKAATRRYARRQRTWLRNQLPADVRRIDAAQPRDRIADEITRAWTEARA